MDMKWYGIVLINSLILSSLTNTQQIVRYQNTLSFPLIVKSRVPQGSILRPLFLSII